MHGEGSYRENLISPEEQELLEIRKHQKNFLEMDLESPEGDELVERVAKYKGVVRIMVHPLFESLNSRREEDFPRAKLTEEGLKSLIAKGKEGAPPIFVMEESWAMEDTQKYLQQNVVSAENVIYYIPTLDHDPAPDFGQEQTGASSYKKEWDRLAALLKDIGVKEALIGGIILRVYKKSKIAKKDPQKQYVNQRKTEGAKDVEYLLAGCVGGTVEDLSNRGIKTKLSNFFSSANDDSQGDLTRADIVKLEKFRSLKHPETGGEQKA